MSRFAKVAKTVSTPTIQAKSRALANKVLDSTKASVDLKFLANDLLLATNAYRDAITVFNNSISTQQTLADDVNNKYKAMGSIYDQLKVTAKKLNKIGIVETADLNDYLSVTH